MSLQRSLKTIRNNQFRLITPFTQSRSIALVRGERLRGAIRDPEEYLTVKNHRYGVTEDNLKYIKNYLTKVENGKFLIPDDLLLQVITHKSFAHGSKPYNEKLSVIGFQLLKYYTSFYSISSPTNSKFAINNLNFDCLGSLVSKFIIHEECLAKFIKSKNINQIIFWKKASPLDEDPRTNGENAVYSKVTSALVGAINLFHGTTKAQEFIKEELLDNQEASLVKTAVELSKEFLSGREKNKIN
ncbi:hypothetical protein PACTADRAFT_73627 [Pachysolen tannophilus NRRL Y-2460]|uniref:RNase III domain-containing protein n=1 Tax=Pachysolen tannophilus NRRL Y-2460 TaxID=669874 RepID=A0A1E4U1T3_PACTA|nr:hypothetical protein PACTADRAFT_73627 [Pachysolen tannophilus NRRL Y-2460]